MRRNWGKKVLMSGLVASMLCGLAGPLNVSADDVTTVEYLFWGNQSEINTIMGTIDAFNKSHTDIQVKGTGIDPSVYLQKLSAYASSNTLPDIVQVAVDYGDEYTKKECLNHWTE